MIFNFCPSCGHEGTVEELSKTDYQCRDCRQEFWNNPKATVGVIFLKNDQLLFSKRGIEPNKGKYDFVGGFVQFNERLEAACIREVYEETGMQIDEADLHLLTTYTEEYSADISVIDHIYIVTRWQGDFKAADDSAALECHPISFVNSNAFVPFYSGLDKVVTAFMTTHTASM